MKKTDLIYHRLQQHFQPTALEVIDESAQHHGHAGFDAGGSHFLVRIQADRFQGKSRVTIHREIYAALSDFFPEQIHALRIEVI